MVPDSRVLTPYIQESVAPFPAATEGAGALPAPVDVGGLPVHPLGVDAVLAWVRATLARGERGRISYANAYNVLLANEDAAYRGALSESDVIFCDGFGVWGASRWLGTPLPERMTFPDWSERLFALAHQEGWSLFFLGAQDGIADLAAARLKSQYPGIQIVTHHGYFDMEGAENEAVVDAIQRAAPRLLLVGMGPPRQELWIHANHQCHEAGMTIAVGCLFDYMAGSIRRGPRWLTGSGGEWLWRLVREPRRLWRRYLLGNPRFVWHILRAQRRASRQEKNAPV